MPEQPAPRGRGSHLNPPNRFLPVYKEADPDPDDLPNRRTQFLLEQARSIVTENTSPDIPFRYSLNPYRGCEHGCSYCFARPTHEYLGLNAGLDFETKILVKENAAELFRECGRLQTWWNLCTQVGEEPFRREIHPSHPRSSHEEGVD